MNLWVLRNRYFFLFVVTFVFVSYAALRSARFGGPESLIGFGCIPDQVCFAGLNTSALPPNAPVFPTGGYDGQFYYYVAAWLYGDFEITSLDEIDTVSRPAHTIVVDSLGFRLPRIGFPLLTGWLYWFGPVALALGMPALLLLSHLIASWVLFSMRRRAGWLFGLNPVSLLSFGLNLAEPMALSLGALSVVLLLARSLDRTNPVGQRFCGPRMRLLCGLVFLLLAILSKETLFLVGMAIGMGFLVSWFRSLRMQQSGLGPKDIDSPPNMPDLWGRMRKGLWRKSLRILGLVVVGLLGFGWYWYADFFGGDGAGGKVQVPFAGVLQFIESRPRLISGRGLLVIGLAWIASYCGFIGFRILRKRSGWLDRIVLPGLVLNLALISMASADEYWLNFANIARLFAPSMILLALGREGWTFLVSAVWAISITILLWLNDLNGLLASG